MIVLLAGRWELYFLAFARACRARGVDVHFLNTYDSTPWSRCSRSLSGGANAEASVEAIADYARTIGANALVTSPDEPFLARLAAEVEAADLLGPTCRLLAAPAKTLEFLYSKQNQIGLAEEVGFDVLPTWYLSSELDALSVPADAFPVVVRPDRPDRIEPAFRVELVRTREALAAVVQGVRVLGAPLIAQPLRLHPNLLIHGVRSESGELLALEGFLGLRKYRGYTLSMKRTPLPSGVARCCRRFVERADVRGCFHFDMLYSPREDRARFLEINTRVGGSTDKATRLGYDEPGLTLAAFGLADVPSPMPSPSLGRSVTNKRGLLGQLLRGGLTDLDFPSRLPGSLSQGAREFLSSRDSVFDWGDLTGSLWYYLRRPSRAVGGLLR